MMDKLQFVSLDTETTGLSPYKGNHRVIEIACVGFYQSGRTERLINTVLSGGDKKSNKKALSIHGISQLAREGKPEFNDIADKLLEILKDSNLVIFNKAFDVSFLENEFRIVGKPTDMEQHCSNITCVMKEAITKFNTSSIRLDQACLRYSIDISKRVRHSADIDAELAGLLHQKLNSPNEPFLKHTPQSKPLTPQTHEPIPKAYENPLVDEFVQLNFCKTTTCKNFGVIAKNPAKSKAIKLKRRLGNDYKLISSNKTGDNHLYCKKCRQSSMLVNNQSLTEEVNRLRNIGRIDEPSCPENHCDNRGSGVYSHPHLYKRNGFTKKPISMATTRKVRGVAGNKPKTEVDFSTTLGSQRFQCKSCKKNFSAALDSQKRHYRRDINLDIYDALLSKGIINQIAKRLDINHQTIYDKINFFYEQSTKFDRYHTQWIMDAFKNYTPVLTCDRQFYLSNWNHTSQPEPTRIVNTTTVDNITGFILASTINFDFNSEAKSVKELYKSNRDFEIDRCYQRYSQYILSNEDMDTTDSENALNVPLQVPDKGLLLHQTYSIMAHLFRVKDLTKQAPHMFYFLDRDSGLRTSLSGVFKERIVDDKMDAYVLAFKKNNSSNLLDKATSAAISERFKKLKEEHPDLSDNDLLKTMWIDHFQNPITAKGQRSEWIPNPNINSRAEALSPVTPVSEQSKKRSLEYLLGVSLHGVDNWFQILRRTVNMLERPVTSATNSRRWNAYAGYNPTWMTKLVEIARVHHNYCETNEKSLKRQQSEEMPTTPAQRLGITNKKYSGADIIGFSVHREIIGRT